MSHAIEELRNGDYSFWFDGRPAWHKIANNVDAPADISDLAAIQKSARLDWEVLKAPMGWFYNGEWRPSNTQFSLVRSTDGKLLSNQVVGESWFPVQNSEAFEFVREFIERNEMKMETCGSLDGGRRVWILAKVNEQFETVKGDRVKAHLLFTTHHQFGQATDVRFVAERVVCANTHAVAMNEAAAHRVSFNHRKEFDATAAKEILGIGSEIMAKYKEATQFLASKTYMVDELEEYADELFPIIGENKREKDRSKNAQLLLDCVDTQPGAEFGMGTFWNAYNASTFLVDHVIGRTADSRLSSAWYGNGMRTKAKALKLALEMAA